ncbi:MAG TPA: hypothetical protein VFL60_08920 [Gaiellaceae bacterium]|nr:hypothetical protein [Gaiellaceae bacterium]
MTRRRFMLLAVTLVALNTFFWLATTGLALPKAIVNEFFGNKLVRAEVILNAPGGAQDWRIDRGVITAVAAGTVTVREADGTSVSVPVDPAARIQGPARFSSAAKLRPRLRVVVYHQANQPAQLVQVEAVR